MGINELVVDWAFWIAFAGVCLGIEYLVSVVRRAW